MLDTLSRRRPIWMVSFALNQADLSEGLRAAFASTVMLLLGNVLHMPEFSWAAIGAFWTCLADAAGSNRMRFASMMSFAVLSTLGGGITAWASGLGLAAATTAVLVFASLGALGRIWGSAAAQVAILAATACVVMVDRPVDGSPGAFRFVALYFGGCLFATALSFTVWRIHPFGASRAAMRSAYSRLADMAHDSARLLKQDRAVFAEWATHAAQHRGQVRAAIEAGRIALSRVPLAKSDRRASFDNLLLALADSEQIFGYLIAVTDAAERGHHVMANPRRAARILDAFGENLLQIGRMIAGRPWEAATRPRDRLHALARRLENALGETITLRFDISFSEVEPAGRPAAGAGAALYRVVRRGLDTLIANASRQSIGARHAARVGVAATVAFLTVRLLHLPFGYWATMATLLILQPSIASSWPRSVERAAGSVVGGLIAAGIGTIVHAPIALSLVVFPFVCATMALRRVSYSLFVLFITPSFVLVADFAAPGGTEIFHAVARLENNVLGCVIALIATFVLWPIREPSTLKEKLSEAVDANLSYLSASLARGDTDALRLERLRRAAGLASNNAEEVMARLRLEHLETPAIERTASTALALLRRVAGTATRARHSAPDSAPNPALAAWIARTANAIEARLGRPDQAHGDSETQKADAFAKDGLSLLEADAVNQVVLLHRLLMENAEGLRQR